MDASYPADARGESARFMRLFKRLVRRACPDRMMFGLVPGSQRNEESVFYEQLLSKIIQIPGTSLEALFHQPVSELPGS